MRIVCSRRMDAAAAFESRPIGAPDEHSGRVQSHIIAELITVPVP
jgi:hypothetical protein